MNSWTPALVITVIHYVVGVAVLGCLLGFGVIPFSVGFPLLTSLIGVGVGGGMMAINPSSTPTQAITTATTTSPLPAPVTLGPPVA